MNNTLTLEKASIKTNHTKLVKKNYFTYARIFVEKGGWRFELYKLLNRSIVFSLTLLLLILVSCTAVILQTVEEIDKDYHRLLQTIEWVVTLLFTIEYLLRLLASPHPWRFYMFKPAGILDFLAIVPTYLTLFRLGTANYLLVIRLIRLFRLIRVVDLVEYNLYSQEMRLLMEAVRNSRRKISLFIVAILVSVTILGSLMYVIEGPENGFKSIPKGIYWAIVTVTTVGYGDVTPQTSVGQMLASLLMLLGFSTIVVFTSIVGAEIYTQTERKKKFLDNKTCLDCGMPGHDSNASYCKYCGSRLWDN
jgi:voltage-gated potassium channel